MKEAQDVSYLRECCDGGGDGSYHTHVAGEEERARGSGAVARILKHFYALVKTTLDFKRVLRLK
ncbi:hypothetical protein E2C01_090041 [Portunus trituberculatus]|uniref:Uncharacterized protein n=1 Tax=Portunus trituberculatus TaxID=210409 RepID=A0A5B7JF59_PORTR|nr:hypothetical protein [Portunus trituberculatus]